MSFESASLVFCSMLFVDTVGASALHWAATTGHISVMKELLKSKAPSIHKLSGIDRNLRCKCHERQIPMSLMTLEPDLCTWLSSQQNALIALEAKLRHFLAGEGHLAAMRLLQRA